MDRLPTLNLDRLGKRIIALRDARGWNQTKLSTKAGIPQSTLSEWERGVSSPPFLDVVKIAKALNVPLDKFIDPTVILLRELPTEVAAAIGDHVESITHILTEHQKSEKAKGSPKPGGA